jgi:hypothetical protein
VGRRWKASLQSRRTGPGEYEHRPPRAASGFCRLMQRSHRVPRQIALCLGKLKASQPAPISLIQGSGGSALQRAVRAAAWYRFWKPSFSRPGTCSSGIKCATPRWRIEAVILFMPSPLLGHFHSPGNAWHGVCTPVLISARSAPGAGEAKSRHYWIRGKYRLDVNDDTVPKPTRPKTRIIGATG